MRLLTVILAVFLLAAPLAAQVNQHIDGYNPEVNLKFVNLPDGRRPFVGRFDFEKLPAPLEPVRVDFTLEVSRDFLVPEGDWKIHLVWNCKAVRLLGDSIFVWPGPHPLGGTYSGSFELVPLRSGLHKFMLYMFDNVDGALDVHWCFDQDGNLTFLDKIELSNHYNDCNRQQCTFFNKDSVYVLRHGGEPSDDDLFLTDFTVKPVFRIGDTSTVRYRLTAVDDLPNPLQIQIYAEGMKVVSEPQRIAPGIVKGDTVYYEIKAVPLPVRDIHLLSLLVQDKSKRSGERYDNIIPCESVYDDDGNLRFIGDGSLWAGVADSLLPKSFRPMREGDRESIIIFPDREQIQRHTY